MVVFTSSKIDICPKNLLHTREKANLTFLQLTVLQSDCFGRAIRRFLQKCLIQSCTEAEDIFHEVLKLRP
eukprot:Skav217458  [mRNA]  locus=scaffold1405:15808:16554:- [translate_table: standard]